MKSKGSMSAVKGAGSSRGNPLPNAKMTQPTSGSALASPANPDQAKVRKLRAKAFTEKDSLRGANGI